MVVLKPPYNVKPVPTIGVMCAQCGDHEDHGAEFAPVGLDDCVVENAELYCVCYWVCDSCDHMHATTQCPSFKDPTFARFTDDAKALGKSDGKVGVREGRRVDQRGDGNCLFWSMLYSRKELGLQKMNANGLRELIMNWLVKNYLFEISGVPMWQWVKWAIRDQKTGNHGEVDVVDDGSDYDGGDFDDAHKRKVVEDYKVIMLKVTRGTVKWGGALEMSIYCHLLEINSQFSPLFP
jgi:hypothetical protein